MNGNSQGQKISPARKFLEQEAFDTGLNNWTFYELVKETTDLMELERKFDIPTLSIRQHSAKICTALRIVAREDCPQTVQTESISVLELYRKNDYSLRATQKDLAGWSFGQIRRAIRAESVKVGKRVTRGPDWDAGKQKRIVFELFRWMKMAHKHFSLKVFCETINWSPRAVLDLCAECNEAGYAVIAPKITGSQLAWLEPYMAGEESYAEAMKNKPIPKRGGKEIFKRLLHQENPGRRTTNLPGRTRKKRNSPGAKRGLVASRGGKVKQKRKIWGNITGEMRAGMQQYLNSLK